MRAAVDKLQRQYVCYGHEGRLEEAPRGWSLAMSDAALAQKVAAGHVVDPGTPHELSLAIVTAPAEYGVPLKQDRQFTPSFKVQV